MIEENQRFSILLLSPNHKAHYHCLVINAIGERREVTSAHLDIEPLTLVGQVHMRRSEVSRYSSQSRIVFRHPKTIQQWCGSEGYYCHDLFFCNYKKGKRDIRAENCQIMRTQIDGFPLPSGSGVDPQSITPMSFCDGRCWVEKNGAVLQ